MFDQLERLAEHLDALFGLKPAAPAPGGLYVTEITQDGPGGYMFDLNSVVDAYNRARGQGPKIAYSMTGAAHFGGVANESAQKWRVRLL